MITHNKFHNYTHYNSSPAENEEVSLDSIASNESPFQGEFYSVGSLITTESLSARLDIFSEEAYIENGLAILGNSSDLGCCIVAASALHITNSGEGPALTVNHRGNESGVSFFNENTQILTIGQEISAERCIGLNTSTPNEHLTVSGNIYSQESVFLGGRLQIKTLSASSSDDVVSFDSTGFIRARPINPKVWSLSEWLSGSSLTKNFLLKSADSNTLVNSEIYESDDQNIGIGTIEPTSKLTVSGNVVVDGNIFIHTAITGGSKNLVTIDSNGTICQREANDVVWYDNLNAGIVGFGRPGDIPVFGAINAQPLTASNVCQEEINNNVGINTRYPNKQLTILGSISSTGAVCTSSLNSNDWNTASSKLDSGINMVVSRVGSLDYSEITINWNLMSFVIDIEPIEVFIHGTYYTIPEQTIDLVNTVGRGDENIIKNTTLYAYLIEPHDGVDIIFLQNVVQDSSSVVYFGKIVTNSDGVQSVSFQKTTRFGNIQIGDTIVVSNSATPSDLFLKIGVSGKTKFLRLYDIQF